jgi:hypothetical protein
LPWSFPLKVRQGANGTVMATINLVVGAAP